MFQSDLYNRQVLVGGRDVRQ